MHRIICLDGAHINLGDEADKVLLLYANDDAFNGVDSATNFLQYAFD